MVYFQSGLSKKEKLHNYKTSHLTTPYFGKPISAIENEKQKDDCLFIHKLLKHNKYSVLEIGRD